MVETDRQVYRKPRAKFQHIDLEMKNESRPRRLGDIGASSAVFCTSMAILLCAILPGRPHAGSA
jgi:hypothetical protein